jgi:septal ring factor EnvC (AmiA/AmiB activator)
MDLPWSEKAPMFRNVLSLFVLAVGSAAWMLGDAPSAVAQKKNDNQAVQKLQKELNEREQQVKQLQQKVQQLEAKLRNENKDDAQADAKIKQLQQKVQQLEAKLRNENKDDVKDDARIRQLQQQLKDKESLITQLQGKTKNGSSDLDALKKTIKDLETTKKKQSDDLDGLKKTIVPLDALKRAKVIHVLALKLADDADADAKIKKLADALPAELTKIAGVRGVYLGKPREKNSATDYHLQATLLLEDEAALIRVLDDAGFKKLDDTMLKGWEKKAASHVAP